MIKILKFIFLGILSLIGVAILAFITVNIFAPGKMQVEKSIVIDAPASAVYTEISDFRNWKKWDPWQQADPNLKGEYGKGGKGLGATWTWESETQGNGKQEIIEVKENEYMKTSLNFEGWDATNYAEFILEDSDNGTKVTWTMDGAENPFFLKFMNLIMEPMVGGNYELGLQNLKEVVENNKNVEIQPKAEIRSASIPDSSSVNADSTAVE